MRMYTATGSTGYALKPKQTPEPILSAKDTNHPAQQCECGRRSSACIKQNRSSRNCLYVEIDHPCARVSDKDIKS